MNIFYQDIKKGVLFILILKAVIGFEPTV